MYYICIIKKIIMEKNNFKSFVKNEMSNEKKEQLKKFFNKYPNGVIEFG